MSGTIGKSGGSTTAPLFPGWTGICVTGPGNENANSDANGTIKLVDFRCSGAGVIKVKAFRWDAAFVGYRFIGGSSDINVVDGWNLGLQVYIPGIQAGSGILVGDFIGLYFGAGVNCYYNVLAAPPTGGHSYWYNADLSADLELAFWTPSYVAWGILGHVFSIPLIL